MTRQVVVSEATYARLCTIAARIKQETGQAASFGEVLDQLLEGNPMAEVNETTQRKCDRDGALSDPAAKGSVPDGWLTGLGLHVQGSFGVLSDLCPACAALPVNQAVILPAPAEAAE